MLSLKGFFYHQSYFSVSSYYTAEPAPDSHHPVGDEGLEEPQVDDLATEPALDSHHPVGDEGQGSNVGLPEGNLHGPDDQGQESEEAEVRSEHSASPPAAPDQGEAICSPMEVAEPSDPSSPPDPPTEQTGTESLIFLLTSYSRQPNLSYLVMSYLSYLGFYKYIN